MITSASNPKIKNIRALIARHKERKASGCFAAEGVRLIKEVPPELIKELYVSESFVPQLEALRAEIPALDGPACEIIADSLFRSVSDTKEPQGILAIVKQPVYEADELLKKKDPFLLVLEDVQDPGNVGTIIRTAEGAGVDGLILSQGCADIFSPKTVRSTMGSLFRVPFILTGDAAESVRRLKQKGIKTYAAMPGAAKDYDEPDYRGGTAVLIGNEGNGLSAALAGEADEALRIPMEGRLESLNAAVAAAIIMYAVRSGRK